MAESLIQKGSITAVLTTGIISASAKQLFDSAGIAWAENIPEHEFTKLESLEM
ncbi:MAG: hypothetical protein KBF99_15730 [Leptospiraceae bacterium]|nr:hypothetical protein [Leptospiraceae bacterium]